MHQDNQTPASENNPLFHLASQLDDVMSQAQFIANWTQAGKLDHTQLDSELNILIAEIWDAQSQVKAMLEQSHAPKLEVLK